MPRQRKQIITGAVYEVIFRAKEGLPLAVTDYMKLIIEGTMARAQRNFPVTICHDVFLGSHPHMILIAKNASDLVGFYGQLQKELTEAIKRLLALEKLNIWDGEPKATRILDLEGAIRQIAYLYNNPTKASLVDSIEKYPGVSSWRDFCSASPDVNCQVVKPAPWIRRSRIEKLPSRALSETQDRFFSKKLQENTASAGVLIREPNAWMKVLYPDSPDGEFVKSVNCRIVEKIRLNEEIYRCDRARSGIKVLGAKTLKEQPLMRAFKPSKKSRSIFVICGDRELRIEFIETFKEFCELCRKAYLRWKEGDFTVEWPRGAFRPSLPPECRVSQS